MKKEILLLKNGDDGMSNVAEKYNTLDLCALMKKKSRIVSSEEDLKDVKPVEWGKEVTEGKRKVIVAKDKRG